MGHIITGLSYYVASTYIHARAPLPPSYIYSHIKHTKQNKHTEWESCFFLKMLWFESNYAYVLVTLESWKCMTSLDYKTNKNTGMLIRQNKVCLVIVS